MVKVGEQGIFLSDNAVKRLSPYMLNAYKKTLVLDLNALQSFTESDPVFSTWLATPPNVSIFTNDAGYLTSFSETDPVYTASSWYSTTNNSSNWNTAYGWGNHASAGYLTGITSGQITTALGYTPYDSTNPSGYITSSSLSSYVPTIRNLTINGTTYDLSSDRSWTISAGVSGSGTSNEIAYFSGSSSLSSLSTATYPSLTELSYVKGLSSAVQTQLNAKESALTISTGLTRATNTITANLSTGVSGGQSVIGGTASGNDLTLSSTSNATKGKILFGTSAYNEVNNKLGLANTSPSYTLDVTGDIRTSGVYRFSGTPTIGISTTSLQFNADLGTVINANSTGTNLITVSNAGIYGFTTGFVTGYTNPFMGLGAYRETGTQWRAYITYPVTFQNLAGDISITQNTGATYGGTFTPAESVRLKAGGTVGIGVSSPTAFLSIKASTTSIPHLNLTAGSAPSSPANGDIWFDGTDIKMRIGGVTKTFTLT